MTIATERLLLRRTRLADVPSLYAFLGDAAAMRHTVHFGSLRECRRYVAAHQWHQRATGHAPWTILRKSDGQIIGWGGLYEDPFDRGWGIEVGYWFAPSSWGNGYATELVRAALAQARETVGLTEVSAFARPENVASCRVLEKAGFHKVRYVASLERNLYRCQVAAEVG